MILTPIGQIAFDCWAAIPKHHPNASLSAFTIMPDHMHGIICIQKNPNLPTSHGLSPSIQNSIKKTVAEKRFQNPGKGSLPTIIGSYKSSVSRIARKIIPEFFWQRDYCEILIKELQEFKNIYRYIIRNPETLIKKLKNK